MEYIVYKQLKISKVVNINRWEDNIHNISNQHLDGDYWKIDSSDPRTQRKLNREQRKLETLGYSTILHSNSDTNNNNNISNTSVAYNYLDDENEEDIEENDVDKEGSEDMLYRDAYEITESDLLDYSESQTINDDASIPVDEDMVSSSSPLTVVDLFSSEEIKNWDANKLRAWSIRHMDPNAYYYYFKG